MFLRFYSGRTAMIGIIVTTVNRDFEQVFQPFIDVAGSRDDITLYVVGDIQYSPVVNKKNVISLTYEEQIAFLPDAGFIPVKSGTRRVIGFLKAVVDGCDYILATDDDNYPLNKETHINDFLTVISKKMPVSCETLRWVNMIENAYEPRIFPRGFSVNHRDRLTFKPVSNGEKVEIKVAEGLWVGEPDVDGTERLSRDPETIYKVKDRFCAVKSPDSYCPFDTQNTLFHKDLLPAMFMERSLARYDDIWMSYVCQVVMKHKRWGVYYGIPYVIQERNPHNILIDLKDEMFGLEYTDHFLQCLEEATPDNDVKQHVQNIANNMIKNEKYRLYGVNLINWLKILESKGV